MQLATHGGYCCGIMHVYGMDSSPDKRNTDMNGTRHLTGGQALARTIELILPVHNAGRVIEVTTAESLYPYDEEEEEEEEERQTSNWSQELINQGFVAVSSFLNSNSGNRVTVWHRHPNLTLYGNVPQPAAPQTPAPEPARPEVRDILVEYCPNFRLNGRGRMFSSVQEVRNQYPLVRQIDRRTVRSDGTIIWEENV